MISDSFLFQDPVLTVCNCREHVKCRRSVSAFCDVSSKLLARFEGQGKGVSIIAEFSAESHKLPNQACTFAKK